MDLDQLFLTHLGSSWAKHAAFADAVADLPCRVDLDVGRVEFGDRYGFDIQYLGSEDFDEGVWIWSWAEEPHGPDDLLRLARELRAWGDKEGVEPFIEPCFKTDGIGGDELALLGCGLTRCDAFFVVSTEDSGVFLLVPETAGQLPERTPEQTVEVIESFRETFDLPDYETPLRDILAHEGYAVDDGEARRWTARHPAGHRLELSFDAQGRPAAVVAR